MKKISFLILIVSVFVVIIMTNEIPKFSHSDKPQITKKLPNSIDKQTTNRFPGEFEKQQAIWLQWPSAVYNSGDHPVYPVTINIIKALAPFEMVNVMTASKDETDQIKALLKEDNFISNNIHFYIVNHLSIWTRDVGPIFIKDKENKLNVVDFGFNNYSRGGNQDYIDIEGQVDKLTAQLLKLPVINTNLISEGGAIESNGQGTLMTTEAVVTKRNPRLTKKQIENEYKKVLGLEKLIWLKKGLPEDDHITGGHINEIARFVNPNTILLAQIPLEERFISSVSQESYKRLEDNYKILLNATDQDGKPFSIVRIPMPPTFPQESKNTGPTPLRSYLNYAVVNGAVLIQTYWKPGRPNKLKDTEEQVKKLFQKLFPGRTIVCIDTENINIWGGGIHCVTQHMPAY